MDIGSYITLKTIALAQILLARHASPDNGA
jgi:hypothetical protein